MTSQLIRVVNCDVCGSEKATEHTLTLDGESVEVDLCPDDDGPLEALQALLHVHGRKPRPPRRGTNGRTLLEALNDTEMDWQLLARTCPVCQYVAPRRTATSTHVQTKHDGNGLAKAEAAAGRVFTCQCGEFQGTYAAICQHQRVHLVLES